MAIDNVSNQSEVGYQNSPKEKIINVGFMMAINNSARIRCPKMINRQLKVM